MTEDRKGFGEPSRQQARLNPQSLLLVVGTNVLVELGLAGLGAGLGTDHGDVARDLASSTVDQNFPVDVPTDAAGLECLGGSEDRLPFDGNQQFAVRFGTTGNGGRSGGST
jgi:hypothetical protein